MTTVNSTTMRLDAAGGKGRRDIVGSARRTIWGPALLAYVVCTFFLAHSSSYNQGLVEVAAAYAILALSLDLVAGATGLYSLGHAGLFAIGAYGTTILAGHYGWNVFAALPVVILAGGIVGLLIGALSLRVSGLYFAITTLIFTIIVTVLVSNMSITGGYQGLSSPTFPSFSNAVTSAIGSSVTWAVSGSLIIAVVVVWSIRSSALYPVLLAIRDSERFASSAGVRTAMTKILLFGLSAALAGLAGWAFSFLGYITPAQFNTTASINVFVMVIIGGMNTRLGPIIGAAFVGLFPVMVSINSLWQEVIYGAIFIAVIIFLPEGFVGVVSRGGRLLLRRWTEEPEESAAPADALAPVFAGAWGDEASIASAGGSANGESPSSVASPGRGGWSFGSGGTTSADPAAPPTGRKVPRGSGDLAQAPGDGPALEALGISFSYTGGVRVLSDVDLVIRRGTVHGLIGPNGSGKSTLVDILSGALFPETGTITINGRRAEKLPAWQRVDLGLMRTFQTAAMVNELTARDNVTIGLYNHFPRIGRRALAWPMIPSARRDARIMAASAMGALGAVGVGRSWTRARVADVPHGVEQLTQLAAACVGRPSMLILDEPLAGLSSEEVEHVASILRRLGAVGVTILVIEHQTRFIFEVCDDVTVLAAGELVTSGSAGDVRVDTRVREVYLGQ